MSEEQKQNGMGFSLSFGGGKAAHRSKRVRVNEEEIKPEQQFVTGFAQSGAVLQNGDQKTVVVEGATKRLIPTQGNDFRGTGPRKYNPRFLPEQGEAQQNGQDEDHFELAQAEEAAPVQYGLSMMGRRRGGQQNGSHTGASSSRPETAREPILGPRVLGTSKDWETEAFQKDVADLPDISTLEEYAAMPVEAFGEAMLRGMGWSEHKETTKEQAKEFVRRAPLLGLGATSALQTHKEKKYIRPGESREGKKDLVVYDEKGNIKHTKTASDKLVERKVKGPVVGKQMRIVKGRHAGIRCKICSIDKQAEGRSQTASVRLYPSEEIVTVRLKELGEIEDKPKYDSQPDEQKQVKKISRAGESADSAAPLSDKFREQQLDDRQAHGNETSQRPWLAPHIRVKVIDKRKSHGKLYLKKGEITDVWSPTSCSVQLDSGGRTDASQHELETVVPRKEGARVLVVAGKLRGHRAKLLDRDPDRSQATIQLTEDFSVSEVLFDEIAEYVGDFGEEE